MNKNKNKTYNHSENKQEKLFNTENSPQVRGGDVNEAHNIIKEALGPNIKR